MNKKVRKPYDFGKDYKALPVKKRVSLIKIARTLLNQQKENNALLGVTSHIDNSQVEVRKM
jgi:hypothetical protein